jgi:hypothetical protein
MFSQGVSEKIYPKLHTMLSNLDRAIAAFEAELDSAPEGDWDTIEDMLSSLKSDIVVISEPDSRFDFDAKNQEQKHLYAVHATLRAYSTMFRSLAVRRIDSAWEKKLRILVEADYLPQQREGVPSTMAGVMGSMEPGAYDA